MYADGAVLPRLVPHCGKWGDEPQRLELLQGQERKCSMSAKPTIVFCHGIWADGSCFNKVIPALQADGHQVMAVQYGLDSYAEDVAAIKRTLNRVSGPVLLVGHSYGGATITAAGADDRVVGLVYIAAVAPDV